MRKEKYESILGLGLSSSCGEPLKLLESMDSDIFTGIELPMTMLETEKGAAVLREYEWRYIHITELTDLALSRRIAEQSSSMINEFINNFNSLLDRAHAFHADAVTVDFAADSASGNPEIYASLQKLIKRLMPKLYETGIKLCVPVRIPPASADLSPEKHLDFLRELMFPGIRFTANIHPHQLNKDFVPETLLKWYRFDLELVRLVYEAEMGNRLVKKLINPWTAYFKDILFKGMLVFSPRLSGTDAFMREISYIREMLSEPEKN